MGTPAARATSAMASLRRVPAASAAATAARRSSGAVLGVVRRPPATTIVTSPRTPASAQATRSASGPRATSSWVLVSSRHTAAGRSAPRACAIAASAAAVRCGASKNTMVRSSSASPSSRRARSPALRGRKPSKQKRSTGSPDTARAVSTADGPGTAVTRTSAATAAATSR